MSLRKWWYGIAWLFIVLEVVTMMAARILAPQVDTKPERTHMLAMAAVFLCLAIYEKLTENDP